MIILVSLLAFVVVFGYSRLCVTYGDWRYESDEPTPESVDAAATC
jgi:hypothetical protein